MIRAWLRRLLRRKKPLYVIIYDELDEDGNEMTEEYYGYFADPAEARTVWAMFVGDHGNKYGNVKLCAVVEDWSATGTIEP